MKVMPPRSLDDEIASLYRGAPEDFIAARNALARTLEGDEAARVKALRKPTVPAWAVDQLAARDQKGVDALVDAGTSLRAAQQAAMSSRAHADRLRDATTTRRAAIAHLVDQAAGALRDAGRSPDPHREDIAATLEAASVDPDLAARLSAGTLDRALSPASAGFGDVTGLHAVPDATGDDRKPSGAGGPSGGGATERDRRAELTRLQRDRDVADRRAARLREDADRVHDRITGMQTRLEAERKKLSVAEAQARGAAADAKRAAAAVDRATRETEARPRVTKPRTGKERR
jgi:hypothetical protein